MGKNRHIVLLVALAVACESKQEGDSKQGETGGGTHYMMVDELVPNNLTRFAGKELKVHGWVLAGSLREAVIDQQTGRTFVLHKAGKRIRVFGKGPKPDTFRDQSEVVVTGRVIATVERRDLATKLGVNLEADEYVLDASDLTTKCPPKYDGAQSNTNLNTTFE